MSCFTGKKGMTFCSSSTLMMSAEGLLLNRFEHGQGIPLTFTRRFRYHPNFRLGGENEAAGAAVAAVVAVE